MKKHFTTTELKEKILTNKKNSVKSFAILPVGCTEQHGPYLPLETDSIIADAICEELEGNWDDRFWFWKLPNIAFTSSKTNQNYSGTVSVSENCFRMYLTDICNSIVKSDFDGIFIFCAHGSVYNASVEVSFNLVLEQFDNLEESKKAILVSSITQFDKAFTQKASYNIGQHADWREFILLYKLLKNKYFKSGILHELHNFQQNNDFNFKALKVHGTPMEFRSVNGVLGEPFPFEESVDMCKLAEEIWDELLFLIKSFFIEETLAFYKMLKGNWK